MGASGPEDDTQIQGDDVMDAIAERFRLSSGDVDLASPEKEHTSFVSRQGNDFSALCKMIATIDALGQYMHFREEHQEYK